MRSIRRSLIVYFLLLGTAALSAVSWLVDQTTAQTLHDRHNDSRDLIEANFQARRREALDTLDRRLLRQAQTIASMSRSITLHYEPLYLFGTLTASTMPQGAHDARFWLAASGVDREHHNLANFLSRHRPPVIHAAAADELLPASDSSHPQEYFQTYRANGTAMQQSASLGDDRLSLDRHTTANAELLKEHYDETTLPSGVRVRRVTLKASVRGFAMSTLPWNEHWRFFAPGKGGKGAGRPGGGPGPGGFNGPGGLGPPPSFELPTFFIQYASDLSGFDAQVRVLQADREDALTRLETEIEQNLHRLRTRLLWTVLATLTALWAGGYLLVHVGLAPLHKLTEAVRRVSPGHLRLDVDAGHWPNELQPIVGRLTESLDQLRQAFAREKQAAADISHELRTPLAALLTTLEVALKKPRSTGEYREILEECRLSGTHMQHLVERLLALARLDAGAVALKPRTVDVADLAQQCADLVRPLARARDLTLRVQTDAALPMQADPDKLREVLTNLLHNAIEYNHPHGSIDLAVQRVNGHVHVSVRDTGIGIPPAARAHIFERFYRADPSRHADTPHAGLGLAIVKSYVDLMGGRIAVESDTGGSTFHVELPLPRPHEGD